MKRRFVAAILAASVLVIGGGCASVLEELIPGEPPNVSTVVYGTVESVRPIERKVTEHDGAEIVVRLDDGTTTAVVQAGSQGLARGQRVRVLSGAEGSRVESAVAERSI
jgi:outer membrane lipoprotein SlyB